MALTVGELVAFLRLDKDQYDRGRKDAERDADTTGREIGEGLTRGMDGRLRDSRGRFVAAGRDAGRGFGEGFGRDTDLIDRLAQRVRDVRTLWANSLGPLGAMARGVGGLAVKAGAASAAVGGGIGLAGATLSLVGSLVSVAGAAPAAAAGLIGYKASVAALKVATLGVGDAIKEELGDAFDKLSPRAQRFVDRIGDLTPALVSAKNAIQDNFFEGLDRYIRPLADTYLPLAVNHGRRLVAIFGAGGQILAEDALNPQTVAAFNSLLFDAERGAGGLVFSFRGLLPVLAQVAAAGAPFLRDMLQDAGGYVTRLQAQLRNALASGAVSDVIGGGVQAARDLFGVLGNVLAIFFRIQQAASAAFGTNVLGLLRNVTGEIREFLGSREGMASVVAVFRMFVPVLGEIGDTVGLLLPLLLPLLPVVRDLALAFLRGLQPVLPVLAELAAVVGQSLTLVMPSLSAFAVALGGALIEAIRVLAPTLPELAASLASLLGPTGALTVLLTALLPLIPSLASTLTFLATVVATVVSAVVRFAATVPGGTEALTGLLAAVAVGKVAGLVGLGPQFATLAGIIFRGSLYIMAAAVRMAASWIVAMGPVGWVIAAIVGLVALVVLNWDKVKRYTAAAWDWVAGKLAGFAAWVVGLFSRWTITGIVIRHWDAIKAGVVNRAEALLAFVRSIPGRITGALGSLGGLLWDAGASIVRGLIDGIKSMIPNMSGVLSGITRMIPNLKGPRERDARLLTPAGQLLIRGLVAGIEAEVPSLRTALRDVTAMIPADAGALSLQANREASSALAARGRLGDATAPAGPAVVELGDVHVWIGDTELTELVDVRVETAQRMTTGGARAGTGRRVL